MKSYDIFPGRTLMLCFSCIVALLAMTGVGSTQEEKRMEVTEQKKAPDDQQEARLPTYNPPRRGAPGDRISGGTRGVGPDGPLYLTVLAPDHVGLTTRPQPVFYWYISRPTSRPVEFTLNDERSGTTLFHTEIPSPVKAGVQRIDLTGFKYGLSPGMEYRWFVAVVNDCEQPSRDFISGGLIQKVEISPLLKEKLSRESRNVAYAAYAEEGIWYDALASISDLLDTSPTDAGLLGQWSGLLDQVGLQPVTVSVHTWK